jgi:hypothetical protein
VNCGTFLGCLLCRSPEDERQEGSSSQSVSKPYVIFCSNSISGSQNGFSITVTVALWVTVNRQPSSVGARCL